MGLLPQLQLNIHTAT